MVAVHNFSYGLLTPALAYVMSCLGCFLGLRCTTRARAVRGASRVRWLLLAALTVGTAGVWGMHFVAMLGFTIPGQTIRYSVPVTIFSMLIAAVVVSVGLLIVGFGGDGLAPLLTGGFVIGLGVASMHYTGMAAMHLYATQAATGMAGMQGGASATSFLLPLIFGISILTLVMTAVISLSPTEAELRKDAELIERIASTPSTHSSH
jgi:NO-binding membrane sensor protein with MHYT domain